MADLIGKATAQGWVVTERVEFATDHTGEHFSDCYYVERAGRRAFMKVVDIEMADISQIMSRLAGFDYESRLLAFCDGRRLRRIVQVLESGKIERDPQAPPVLRYIPFLVFELAKSDLRSTVDVSKTVEDEWRFFALHQTAVALGQLHQHSIAHQDIKSSNVLVGHDGAIKIADLGRSSLRSLPAPHDEEFIAGAIAYAPFEQRYRFAPSEWGDRRICTDLFHLGALIVFTFTNVCFPQFVMDRLAYAHLPDNWGGAPYAEVMPHVQAAMAEAMADIAEDFPMRFREDLVALVRDLCHADPSVRGRGLRAGRPVNHTSWTRDYEARLDILHKRSRVRVPQPSHV